MGFFYTIQSLALSEDLPGLEGQHAEGFYTAAEAGYSKVIINLAKIIFNVTLKFRFTTFAWLRLNIRNYS